MSERAELDEADFIAVLRGHVERRGGVRAYARHIGVSAAHISDILSARREPGPKVLKPMSLEKRVHRSVSYHTLPRATVASQAHLDGEG